MSNTGAVGGRRSKGERLRLVARPPAEQKLLYEEIARQRGLNLSDYTVLVLAQAHHLEVPEFVAHELELAEKRARDDEGEGRPMARSA